MVEQGLVQPQLFSLHRYRIHDITSHRWIDLEAYSAAEAIVSSGFPGEVQVKEWVYSGKIGEGGSHSGGWGKVRN